MDFLAQYSYIVIAALVVLVLLFGLAMIMKRVSGRTRGRQGSRLGISEYHVVDEQRRLVIVRRDNVEHLLLIGGQHDLVVETDIRSRSSGVHEDNDIREQRSPAAPELRVDPPAPPVTLRPAPRAPVFADRRPQLRSVDTPLSSPPRKFNDDE